MSHISIVVCSFNPNERTFSQCLAALSALKAPTGCTIEFCLVDNNSRPPLNQLKSVADFLAGAAGAKLIVEPTPGLTHARICGAAATTGEQIVFFDDDNAPAPDYLIELLNLTRDHPCVGAWGAGCIQVLFQGSPPSWIGRYRSAFLQKDIHMVQYGRCDYWSSFYPKGAGLAVARALFESYVARIHSHSLSATDRAANRLSSGGDSQIVYSVVLDGACAGISPSLRLEHLIDERRMSVRYLKRLLYGVEATGIPAMTQAFPETASRLTCRPPTDAKVALVLFWLLCSHLVHLKLRLLPLSVANYVGEVAGKQQATRGRRSHMVSLVAAIFGLE